MLSRVWSSAIEGVDARPIEIETHIEPGLPRMMRGDPGRVRQVAGRLVSNAIRRSPGGRVLIRAQTEPRAPTGGNAILARFIGEEADTESGG